MANIKSNDKSVRQDKKRNFRNKSNKTQIKNTMKLAADTKDAKDINAAIKAIDKAHSAGAIHANKASRLKSKVHKI
ncbi:MAG: 30S ribosomal protein S20 [Epsilonproteobacteria bacterium]|nr:MAG: 30S ribosomal protein S20 [Campylobacterota bacterium]